GLSGVELSLALVDDVTIRALNRRHRKKDKPTDVLSFPLQELAPGAPLRGVHGALGDVIISVPTARAQARQRRRPLLDELTMLLAHGLLHLLGFDHRTDAEEADMTARTRALERAAAARRSTSSGKRVRRPAAS
ncbi:MAG TPA: rRNA maturation RNase YbeY, partial [Minicystis sp.]|nr:rRNA maturation RNase YbeY [Minicystis sp.]